MRLPDSVALVGATPVDLRFDVVKRTDPFQRLAGDLRAGLLLDVEESPAQMRPTGGFPEPGLAIPLRQIEVPEAGIGIGLQDPLAGAKVFLRVLALAIG